SPPAHRRQFYRLRSVLSCIPRHVGCGCWSRTGYRQVMNLEWSSVPLTRYRVRGLNSLACAAYIRPAQNWRMAEDSNPSPEGATVFKTAARPRRLHHPDWRSPEDSNLDPPPSEGGTLYS